MSLWNWFYSAFPDGFNFDVSLLGLTAEAMPSMLGILGLLLSWELHDLEVRAGRIQPHDVVDQVRQWAHRSLGVRMYIHATPNDALACAACQVANGRVFSRQAMWAGRTSAICSQCKNPGGCRCAQIGLVGAWPEGEELWRRVRGVLEPIRLSELEITQLVRSGLADRSLGMVDRLALYMLGALHLEGLYPPLSIFYYHRLIRAEDEGHLHPYVVEAYVRLSDLLERSGHLPAALLVVEEFNVKVTAKAGIYRPTLAQTLQMLSRERRLYRFVSSDRAQGGTEESICNTLQP